MKQSEYDRICIANHEAGHAVVAFIRQGLDGLTVMQPLTDGGIHGYFFPKNDIPCGRQASVAGMVATAMSCPYSPMEPAAIIESWRANEFVHRGDRTAGFQKGDTEPLPPIETDDAEKIIPRAVMPSESDMRYVAADWAGRCHDVIEAYWAIRENEDLFEWYRATLLRNGAVGMNACRFFKDGGTSEQWDEADASTIEKFRKGELPGMKQLAESTAVEVQKGERSETRSSPEQSDGMHYGNRGSSPSVGPVPLRPQQTCPPTK